VNLGAPELLILAAFGAIALLTYGPAIWVLVDAARRPDWQFTATGQNRTVWIVLPVVGMVVCCLVSVVAFIVYFSSVRPKLERAPYPQPGGIWPGGEPMPPPPPPQSWRPPSWPEG
jgi:hypothetical protein